MSMKTTKRITWIIIISQSLLILFLVVYARIQIGYAEENLATAMVAQEEAQKQAYIAQENAVEARRQQNIAVLAQQKAEKQAERAALLEEKLKKCE